MLMIDANGIKASSYRPPCAKFLNNSCRDVVLPGLSCFKAVQNHGGTLTTTSATGPSIS
jgi:hypothetical protein